MQFFFFFIYKIQFLSSLFTPSICSRLRIGGPFFGSGHCGGKMPAFLNNLATVSEGCAPTPNQYFDLWKSNRTSFTAFSPFSICSFVLGGGIGSYVPMTSIGKLFRTVLGSCVSTLSFFFFLLSTHFALATTILYVGENFLPNLANLILTDPFIFFFFY